MHQWSCCSTVRSGVSLYCNVFEYLAVAINRGEHIRTARASTKLHGHRRSKTPKTMQDMLSKHFATAVCFLLLCIITEAKRDYYDIIEVPQSASERQIKKAFHKLAMKYHPDKNNSPDAEVIFREIVEAYEVLANDVKRRRYDELRHKTFKEDSKDENTFNTNIFHFSFEELFHGLGLEDDLFLDSPEDTWSFQMGDVDEGDTHQGGSVFDRDFFSFLGGDSHEMSLDHIEDGFQDLEQSFCWIKTHSDGSTTRVCEED